jgi:hypothetical protein
MIKFLRQFPEIWALPVAILAWWLLPKLTRLFDPTAGEFDASIFQLAIIAAVVQLFANAFVFAGLKFNFPKLYKWYASDILPSPFRFFLVLFIYKLEYALILLAIAS